MSVLSWMEMPDEDQPPEHMWMNDKMIGDHFDLVRQRYKEKYSGGDGMESVPEAGTPMQDNEYVSRLLG